MFWLCGKEQHLTEVPHDARKGFSNLAPPMPSTTPCLLLFHTPNHKFAILCVGNSTTFEACLLQSNQDSYTSEGTTFTLQDYLAHDPTRMKYQELTDFIGDMQLAVSDRESCPAVFQKHFGIPFKTGHPDDFWFTQMQVSAVSVQA